MPQRKLFKVEVVTCVENILNYCSCQLCVYRELADVPAATDQAVELSKFSEVSYA